VPLGRVGALLLQDQAPPSGFPKNWLKFYTPSLPPSLAFLQLSFLFCSILSTAQSFAHIYPCPASFSHPPQNRQSPTLPEVCSRDCLPKRLTVHRKPLVRPPRFPQHWSPLDAPGSFIWKTEAHEQQGSLQQCDPGGNFCLKVACLSLRSLSPLG
jgi:hypothetical protein